MLKIVWSIDYEYLIVIGLDSSITSYLVKDNFEKLSVIHPPTRFKTFCYKFVKSDDKSYLISAFTGKIVVSEIGGANYEFKLDTYAACNSIVSGITNGVLTLLLSFDTGKFKTIKFDITSKTLLKFHWINLLLLLSISLFMHTNSKTIMTHPRDT